MSAWFLDSELSICFLGDADESTPGSCSTSLALSNSLRLSVSSIRFITVSYSILNLLLNLGSRNAHMSNSELI